jgi:hypothetical protein
MVAAIIVQAALFAAGHACQGPVGMIPIGVGGTPCKNLLAVRDGFVMPLACAPPEHQREHKPERA